MTESLHIYRERLHATGDLANLKIQNANMVAQLRILKREEEIKNQEASLREKKIVQLKKEIRELKLATMHEEEDRPRVVSDVHVRINIVLIDEIRRPPVPGRGGLPSGSTAASAFESEEINLINKQISELAARRRHLKSNLSLNQGQVPLGTERSDSNRGTRPRPEEFPELPPMMAPSIKDRGKDRGTTYSRRLVRAEIEIREIGSQPARCESRPPLSTGATMGRTFRNTFKRRSPRSAAVSIICTDATLSYSDDLKKAREMIGPLDKFGIEELKDA